MEIHRPQANRRQPRWRRLVVGVLAVLACLAVAAPGGKVDAQSPVHSQPQAVTQRALTLRIDPNFAPDALNAEQRHWYDALWRSIQSSREWVDSRAAGRDLYRLGRTIGNYNAALLMGLRMTGDRSLLDRVVEVSEIYRSTLADEWLDGTTDGFLNWVWKVKPDNETYYGNDLHQADEVIMHGNVALVAYALHLNRDVDPSYGVKADAWVDYLENHFLNKWYLRSGGTSAEAWDATESEPHNAMYRRYVVTRSNQLRIAYYLWKMTGKRFYLDRALTCIGELRNHPQMNPQVPTAYMWKHQLTGKDQGWQRINYAQYFLRVLLEMHFEVGDVSDLSDDNVEAMTGLLSLADDSAMAHYASTFSDVVFSGAAGTGQMARRVDGSESVGLAVYGLSGFGRWDPSGLILERANQAYADGVDGASVAGYALVAVTGR